MKEGATGSLAGAEDCKRETEETEDGNIERDQTADRWR
jgi:hypothetical protein